MRTLIFSLGTCLLTLTTAAFADPSAYIVEQVFAIPQNVDLGDAAKVIDTAFKTSTPGCYSQGGYYPMAASHRYSVGFVYWTYDGGDCDGLVNLFRAHSVYGTSIELKKIDGFEAEINAVLEKADGSLGVYSRTTVYETNAPGKMYFHLKEYSQSSAKTKVKDIDSLKTWVMNFTNVPDITQLEADLATTKNVRFVVAITAWDPYKFAFEHQRIQVRPLNFNGVLK